LRRACLNEWVVVDRSNSGYFSSAVVHIGLLRPCGTEVDNSKDEDEEQRQNKRELNSGGASLGASFLLILITTHKKPTFR